MPSRSDSSSPTRALTPPEQSLADLRLSGELDRANLPSSLTLPNGTASTGVGVNGSDDSEDLDPVERLQKELNRTKEEKDALASQYRTLLSRLTAMRDTLGNKLKQDAVCLSTKHYLLQIANHTYA